jgi:hypothetical protein
MATTPEELVPDNRSASGRGVKKNAGEKLHHCLRFVQQARQRNNSAREAIESPAHTISATGTSAILMLLALDSLAFIALLLSSELVCDRFVFTSNTQQTWALATEDSYRLRLA